MKKIIKRFLDYALILIVVYLLFLCSTQFAGLVMNYQDRFIECEPYNLISSLRKIYGVDFSKDIKDVKAAKTTSQEGSIYFMLKFIDDPCDVNIFLKSFLQTDLSEDANQLILRTYTSELDYRKQHFWPHGPKWFIEDIGQGAVAERMDVQSQDARVYVDTSNKDFFIVYIKGAYLAKYEEKPDQ